MAKKLQEWLDDFIENGFSSDVSHWPEEGSVETNQPSVNIIPSTSAQTILPDEGYIGFDQAVVAAVDNTIDNNIQAENIKKNVTILGVTGNYEAPEVPAYTGPYTITENGTIAISGKQATQDITVNVPSPSYENGKVYYYGRIYDSDSDNPEYQLVVSDGSGGGVYYTFYDDDEDVPVIQKVSDYTLDDDEICYYSNNYLTSTSAYWGGSGLYYLGGSSDSKVGDGLWLIDGNDYEEIELPDFHGDGTSFSDDYNTYYITGSGVYLNGTYLTDSLYEGYYHYDGNFLQSVEWPPYSMNDGEIYWFGNDSGTPDCLYKVGSSYYPPQGEVYILNKYNPSVENIGDIDELDVGSTTTLEFDGKTYEVTRTA